MRIADNFRSAGMPRPSMHNCAARTWRVDSPGSWAGVPQLHTGFPRRSAFGLTRPRGLALLRRKANQENPIAAQLPLCGATLFCLEAAFNRYLNLVTKNR
jgi:hypothetical protein